MATDDDKDNKNNNGIQLGMRIDRKTIAEIDAIAAAQLIPAGRTDVVRLAIKEFIANHPPAAVSAPPITPTTDAPTPVAAKATKGKTGGKGGPSALDVKNAIADALKADPSQSDRTIAKALGCDRSIVAKVRKTMKIAPAAKASP